MQNLEKSLGTILINRNNKSITLTQAGEILYNYSLEILNSRNKALYSLGEYKGSIEGLIEIAASSIPEGYVLPSFLKAFTSDYPDVKFSLVTMIHKTYSRKYLSRK